MKEQSCVPQTVLKCEPALLLQLIAVYEQREAVPEEAVSPRGGGMMGHRSPESYDSELPGFRPIRGGEIEVNSSILKSSKWFCTRKH
ncbi:hypothetical protein Z043_119207 [Scleropages formosus]|uniref:Uncharacterized protein n=1 Tax=Scleropages formosus TaxID=113540 RepID=A0A0N8JUR6_SCLFO|nr:hypothetical protein Z043_119207 [Scleropages formosus]